MSRGAAPGGPFARPGPRWFTIPAHRPFTLDLARGLAESLAPLGPEALTEAVVLTPTRRGARALAEAFLTVSGGKAVLLPQVRALGDLDEGEPPFEPGDLALDLPPAVSPYRRRFELARLVAENGHLFDRPLDASAALELADALAGFLDSLQIEEADGAGIDALAPAEMAEHWRKSADFLKIALDAWPRRLRELGLIDVSERRVRLLRLLEHQWTDNPPQTPLIAAGSTGSAPATAGLLGAVAKAPLGAVVLPGLDLELAEKAWAAVDRDQQHPQWTMKALLALHRLDRSDVWLWPMSKVEGEANSSQFRGRWRRRLVNEALRPADETADWRDQIAKIRREGLAEGADPIALGLSGLSLIATPTEEEAAAAAALLLREALETPGMTAALVTPDRDLARRVSARLARWGIEADSSAGAPLAHCPAGVLLGLLARAALDPCDPVRLLALLKHPMTRLGLGGDRALALIALEQHGLRGPRPSGWDALEARLAKAGDVGAADLLHHLRQALAGLTDPDAILPASARARALAETAEAIAADEAGHAGNLWAGPGGEAAAQLVAALLTESAGLPETDGLGFARLIESLMAGATVRSGGATHPRLRILGAIEARLVRADRLILAGLEEGVWPQGAPIDPFLSRPMRSALGLPPPERRIGLSAHDFAQAACAPEVYLLHAERREGAPAVESRWLWRLKTLARGAGVALPGRPEVLAWAKALDEPGPYAPLPRAAFAPPLAARPLKLPVTQAEALTRDPYAVYARYALGLYLMPRPDEPMEQRARGTAIHAAFEVYAEEWPAPPARFAALYMAELARAGAPASALARETALAEETAVWVGEMEERRRADGRQVHVEQSGQAQFATPRGPFTITAKADRIEVAPDGRAHVLDFKTGMAPSKKQMKTGFSPQLTLTAAIIARGGFKAVGQRPPGDLVYVRVTGRDPAGEEIAPVAGEADAEALPETAWAGLETLVLRYEDETHPYRSRTAPQFVKTYGSDYDHLARVGEWAAAEEEGE
ncbi:MAG TPA: double-strand break repair protein AddB [Caulobacteraceae bacterium]